MFMTSSSAWTRLACLALFAAPLGACSTVDRVSTASVVPHDYRARHPLVLANAPVTLEIFLPGADGKLDDRQRDDVKAFAAEYRNKGTGVIQILSPRGAGAEATAARTVQQIRAVLSKAGVKGYVNEGTYPVVDPQLAAPVRMSFSGLQARTAEECGQWPEDLASGGSFQGMQNRPYYNFGCAYQQNLAAQIADPRDLVRPRTQDPADSQMRIRAIESVRRGEAPTTSWPKGSNAIGNTVP